MTKPTAEQLELALKPCPFCGGEAEMFERWSRLWMVKCGACGVLLDPDERSQEACIKEWNRRHTTPEIAAMMSKHVENWPEHKKLSTSIALIDKTIAAALEVHQLEAFARHRLQTEARMAAAVEALNGYKAAVAFVAADAWDGCPDCIDILKAARCADTVESLTPDEIAANLKRIRPHYQPAIRSQTNAQD